MVMKRIFLLGGSDLEMATIKELLNQYKEIYFDKQLLWQNARLDAYREELDRFGDQPDIQIYGIELREHISSMCYGNYRLIDHHNALSANPASIIQVASIIGHSLTPYQQLVAANDSGYIPAMQQLGATAEQIKEIRRLDRIYQGVTEKDEKLAELAILYHLEQHGSLISVKTELSCFSPICDRLYPFDNLLVYTDKEWVFYGQGVEKIKSRYAKQIKEGCLYYGGGERGFLGAVVDAFSPEEIIQMKNEIITLINK